MLILVVSLALPDTWLASPVDVPALDVILFLGFGVKLSLFSDSHSYHAIHLSPRSVCRFAGGSSGLVAAGFAGAGHEPQ